MYSANLGDNKPFQRLVAKFETDEREAAKKQLSTIENNDIARNSFKDGIVKEKGPKWRSN